MIPSVEDKEEGNLIETKLEEYCILSDTEEDIRTEKKKILQKKGEWETHQYLFSQNPMPVYFLYRIYSLFF